jgi:hypothetical protein
MAFSKTASAEILGVLEKGNWAKSASMKVVSYYMENSLSFDLEEKLDAVADLYKISKNPADYLLIPARANSVGRFNANLDGWTFDELVNFRPKIGCRTYSTYNHKPHFVEHNASRYEVARGMILDSHLNMDNDASDEVKEQVMQAIGSIPKKDAFVEVILAVDQKKDPTLANAYKNGSIKTFSMGADVEDTVCNICNNVATSTWEFCDHIRGKHRRLSYNMPGGSVRIAGELCRGTIFQELSVVSDPADKTAVIQEGILEILNKAASNNSDLQEIVSFTAKFAKDIPESLARVINEHIKGRK